MGEDKISYGEAITLANSRANEMGLAPSDSDGYIFFWKIGQPNDIYSNWYPAWFVVEGVRYETSEQYIMAKKALLLGDTRAYNKIMGTADPAEAKKYGREAKDYTGKLGLWPQVRFDVAFNANFAKFTQNPDLCYEMMESGNAHFAEASPVDKVWGIGLDADNPLAQQQYEWQGNNLQGLVLDAVRYAMRKHPKIDGYKCGPEDVSDMCQCGSVERYYAAMDPPTIWWEYGEKIEVNPITGERVK